MRKLAILSVLAMVATFGTANAQMGGGMNPGQTGGMMNQQGMQSGGMMKKRMTKKQIMAMKKKQMMMRRKNMSGM